MELCDVFDNIEYEIVQYGKKPVDIQGITIDSRTAKDGYIFICIAGLHQDGHKYIEKAAENGATVVVSEKEGISFPDGITVISVKSTRNALNKIAGNFFDNPAKRMRIVGVTGTNGKTSVTYFLEKILQECGYTVGIIGTSGARANNTSINIPYSTSTTPDTIELHAIFAEMAKLGINYVIMEVTSHALALDKVGSIEFAAGIFTNLTQDHLDFHKTMEAYLQSKAKLFDHCKVGIVNGDDKASSFLIGYAGDKIKMYTYGIDGEFDYKAENIKFSNDSISFDLTFPENTQHFKLNIPGKFSAYNALAVIATALALKLPVEKIAGGISKITGVPGRLQNIPNNNGISIIVDYAHTPDAIENIIKTVREFTTGRVITVFGCGGDRDAEKRPIMGRIAGMLSDFCIITSDNPRNETPELIIDEIEQGLIPSKCTYVKLADRKEAIYKAISYAKTGDSVIIAGKGHENYQEFENKRRIHFDDVKIASEALSAIS